MWTSANVEQCESQGGQLCTSSCNRIGRNELKSSTRVSSIILLFREKEVNCQISHQRGLKAFLSLLWNISQSSFFIYLPHYLGREEALVIWACSLSKFINTQPTYFVLVLSIVSDVYYLYQRSSSVVNRPHLKI